MWGGAGASTLKPLLPWRLVLLGFFSSRAQLEAVAQTVAYYLPL